METIICIIFGFLIVVLVIFSVFFFGYIIWALIDMLMDEIRSIRAEREYKKMLKYSPGFKWMRSEAEISFTKPKLHHSCDDIEK